MAPLVMTWSRLLVVAAVAAALGVGLANLVPANVAEQNSRVLPVVMEVVAVSLVAFWVLRGEESRLARELRSARTATPALREQAIRRRRSAPYWSRWFSPTLGTTALLLAEGNAPAARVRLDANPRLFGFGTIVRLAEVVEADLDRASGGPAELEGAIARLAKMEPLAHQEAERYRVHVLVKAILEQGDVATGRGLADELSARPDEELRVYVVWLRTWFDLDHLPTSSEADVRLALLLARSHGADELVSKLERPEGAPDVGRIA